MCEYKQKVYIYMYKQRTEGTKILRVSDACITMKKDEKSYRPLLKTLNMIIYKWKVY